MEILLAQIEGQKEVTGVELARVAGFRSGEVLGRERQL